MSDLTLQPRRSVLYVPATNPRAMTRSWLVGADSIIFDLEDAVAPAAKADARAALIAQFSEFRLNTPETVIRVNALGSEDFSSDLAAVVQCQPRGVLLPKVNSAHDLHVFNEKASRAGISADTHLWVMVETAAGIAELDSIVRAGKAMRTRLCCLVVGTNDIAKETGVYGGDGRTYMVPWLMGIVLVAKRHGVPVLDGVWNDFKNEVGFELEAQQGMKMGFDGKTLIHPIQVDPANINFSPSPEAVAEARRIVAIFSDPRHAAANVVNLEGRMVERLHLEQAQRLLAIHSRISGATSDL